MMLQPLGIVPLILFLFLFHKPVEGFVVLREVRCHTAGSGSLKLYREVEAAIAEAQIICGQRPDSPECKVAWDIVEELEAADSHKQVVSASSDDVASAMDVQALLASFEILTHKLDGTMDQLIATCEKFEEWGADPSVVELSQLAHQMKEGMAYVKNRLNQQ
jgi:CP12 domain